MRLWVVEDDDDFLRALRWRLKRTAPHVEVIQIDSPDEALRRMVAGDLPDALISDLMFRGCASGEDVILAARRRDVPSLLCSDLMEAFGPAGMIRKVRFLESPWRFMCDKSVPSLEASACA